VERAKKLGERVTFRSDRGALSRSWIGLSRAGWLILRNFPRFLIARDAIEDFGPEREPGINYFATSTQRVSRITVMRICPGY